MTRTVCRNCTQFTVVLFVLIWSTAFAGVRYQVLFKKEWSWPWYLIKKTYDTNNLDPLHLVVHIELRYGDPSLQHLDINLIWLIKQQYYLYSLTTPCVDLLIILIWFYEYIHNYQTPTEMGPFSQLKRVFYKYSRKGSWLSRISVLLDIYLCSGVVVRETVKLILLFY
jgi:hypothetical protein